MLCRYTMENLRPFQSFIYSFISFCLIFQNSVSGLSVSGNRQSRQIMAPAEQGFGCGSISMRPNQIIQIQSNNFGIGNYFNNEGCTWTFSVRSSAYLTLLQAAECTPSIYCPCFDLPTSFGCFEDYLKISHQQFFSNRFCGKSYPVGVYRATTNSLTVQFKSDNSGSGKGFLCYVRCTAPGMADPVVTSAATCPPNGANPYGFPS